MTTQKIKVGDTGLGFVSKFNANFEKTKVGQYTFNVEDYGAVHDGITDDTEAIQEAINAAYDAKGGTVYFPCGIYVISGDLQNGIACIQSGVSRDVDFNSQLYIKPDNRSHGRYMITLEGELRNPYHIGVTSLPLSRVILKSTIAGTGNYPSVIGTGTGEGIVPNNHVEIKNINIVVNPFIESGGISMCGVNFYYSNYNIIDGLYVGPDMDAPFTAAVQPINHVFGLCTGKGNGDFPIIKNFKCFGGFYYGLIIGDGVHAYNVTTFWNYIGIMSAFGQQCGSIIQYGQTHWNTYDIAAQQETLFGFPAVGSTLYINHLNREVNEGYGPAWTANESFLLDTGNNLKGYCNMHNVGSYPVVKTNGGVDFLLKDKRERDLYWWTTDTRPTIYCMGYNTTTGKIEALDGTGWHDLY